MREGLIIDFYNIYSYIQSNYIILLQKKKSIMDINEYPSLSYYTPNVTLS